MTTLSFGRARNLTLIFAAVFAFVAAASARQNPAGSPPAGDQKSIALGMKLFRERCAECHGADAKGVAGHDLTRLWASGMTDAQVFAIIRNGVPNTLMPSSSAPDDELWAIVGFLRSLSVATSDLGEAGNIAAGERTFMTMCASCHMVNGRGGRLGPDLSRVAQTQSREQLTRSIRTASAAITPGYQPVTLVTRDGRRIRGARKSEDAFSIQIMETQERLQGYLKADLREVIREGQSLMPDFGQDRLSDRDLEDLLRFLTAAAGPAAPRR